MPYKRGEVVLVLFPNTNLVTAKKRPALVIQADNLGTGHFGNDYQQLTPKWTY